MRGRHGCAGPGLPPWRGSPARLITTPLRSAGRDGHRLLAREPPLGLRSLDLDGFSCLDQRRDTLGPSRAGQAVMFPTRDLRRQHDRTTELHVPPKGHAICITAC